MLNIRDLRIDPASLGRKMLLVDVMPAYEYKDGKRTETVSGYRYVVCLAGEIGENGTYHTHLFLYTSSPMRFGTVMQLLHCVPEMISRPFRVTLAMPPQPLL